MTAADATPAGHPPDAPEAGAILPAPVAPEHATTGPPEPGAPEHTGTATRKPDTPEHATTGPPEPGAPEHTGTATREPRTPERAGAPPRPIAGPGLAAPRPGGAGAGRVIAGAGRVIARHRWFAAVLAFGVAYRVVVMFGFRPAIWFPDSYTYVVTALRPSPDLVRPAGYSLFLRLLEPLHSFAAVAAVQHLLGLATGVLVYATVLRRGGRRWAAAAAAAPVLLDAYQLQLEHLLVSDALFMFLVVAAVVIAVRRPLTWRAAALSGVLLAGASLTRTAGLPLVAVVVAGVLARHLAGVRRRPGPAGRRGWRRAAPAGVLLLAALVPIAGYAAWFSATHHRVGLVGANGVFLYARVMSFADCGVMRPPPDLAVLCDPAPPGRRPPAQFYVWSPDSPLVALPGITFTAATDRLAGRFAMLAVRSQPDGYLGTALAELSRTFTWGRPVYPDQETYDLYEFPAAPPRQDLREPARLGAELAERYERGPIGLRVVEPYAGWARAYQDVARLPGAVLLAVLLAAPAAAAWRRRRAPGPGAPWVPPWAVAAALLAVPAATAEFDYRYVLPAVPLACLAAALAAVRPARSATPPTHHDYRNIHF
ncbi:hypothetical protein Sru01_04130 [Sphaerisporangium rufum]|uniref:ArnT-like N-terminal domain-containing protein n=1 Tax=Sphaerisporangium rufum TaxID=1381558 RepID=A0A919UVV7_9ACTN|nr:phospholipid carrier-dependent glycosyltransferase [Sphaerisporangium rufum]GII75431.1 hypothetical protein Sru01_04130 [Sphaerisporangium rufum]